MVSTIDATTYRLTVEVLYENALPASDPVTLEQLKELSSRRRDIESINQNSFVTEAISREMSGGLTSRCEQNIQQVEQYLPLLGNLIHHVNIVGDNPKMVRWISDLKIRWSSTLTSSSFFHINGPKLYQMDNLHFELAMTLFVLGALLRDRALEVLSTDLVQSASVLRKAAGVYQHLAQDVLPCLQPALAPERPPEALISVSAATALVCLAEEQAVTVRRAEQKGNTGGLLAKLHYGVCEIFNESINTLHSATKQCKDISSLMKYVRDILDRFKMKNCNPVNTPVESGLKLNKAGRGDMVDNTLFRQIVGSLMYLTATRPDIMYARSLISRYMESPAEIHLLAAKRIVRYLQGAKAFGLFYKQVIMQEIKTTKRALQAMFVC